MLECYGCTNNWDLGRFGCHYEPRPDDIPEDEEFCAQQVHCLNWADRRKEFYPQLEAL
jgi:hypothetical protein